MSHLKEIEKAGYYASINGRAYGDYRAAYTPKEIAAWSRGYMRYKYDTQEEIKMLTTSCTNLEENQLDQARDEGLLLHNEQEWQDGELVRNDWYGATLEWVTEYHQNGGTWEYRD